MNFEFAAAFGYGINFALSGLIIGVLVERVLVAATHADRHVTLSEYFFVTFLAASLCGLATFWV